VAQFDAYPNPTAAHRDAFPYLVCLQSDQLSGYTTRLMMPLARLPATPANLPRRLSQSVEVKGERLFLAPHLCAAFPSRLLRKPVASLRGASPAFIDALDAVVSGV